MLNKKPPKQKLAHESNSAPVVNEKDSEQKRRELDAILRILKFRPKKEKDNEVDPSVLKQEPSGSVTEGRRRALVDELMQCYRLKLHWPNAFRKRDPATCINQLEKIASAAEIIARTVDDLYEPSIEALAQCEGGHFKLIYDRAVSTAVAARAAVERIRGMPAWAGERRPPNHEARGVARIAFNAFVQLTGRMPTMTIASAGETFISFLEQLFEALEIKVSAEVFALAEIKSRKLAKKKLEKPQ